LSDVAQDSSGELIPRLRDGVHREGVHVRLLALEVLVELVSSNRCEETLNIILTVTRGGPILKEGLTCAKASGDDGCECFG